MANRCSRGVDGTRGQEVLDRQIEESFEYYVLDQTIHQQDMKDGNYLDALCDALALVSTRLMEE
jgi:hypothetical protein